MRPNGWISKVGWGPQPLGISLDPLVQKNITLQGSFSHNWPIWERVIRLLSTGILNVDRYSAYKAMAQVKAGRMVLASGGVMG